MYVLLFTMYLPFKVILLATRTKLGRKLIIIACGFTVQILYVCFQDLARSDTISRIQKTDVCLFVLVYTRNGSPSAHACHLNVAPQQILSRCYYYK